MTKKYEVTYTVTVELTINDDDIVDRVLTDDWQQHFYADFDEDDALDMLAMSCGIQERSLDTLDGWADCDPENIKCDVGFDLDSVKAL